MQRRQGDADAEALRQRRLRLGQGGVGHSRHQLVQVGRVGLEDRATMPAITGCRHATGAPQPLHELDRGRWADVEATRCRTDRAALLGRANDPRPQIQGNRSWHDEFSADLNR